MSNWEAVWRIFTSKLHLGCSTNNSKCVTCIIIWGKVRYTIMYIAKISLSCCPALASVAKSTELLILTGLPSGVKTLNYRPKLIPASGTRGQPYPNHVFLLPNLSPLPIFISLKKKRKERKWGSGPRYIQQHYQFTGRSHIMHIPCNLNRDCCHKSFEAN